jgi:hypothetical protein
MRASMVHSRRRRLLIGLALVVAAAVGASVSHGPFVRSQVQTRLADLSARLGPPIEVERIDVTGLAGVHLEGLTVGPHVRAQEVDARLTARELLAGQRRPREVHVNAPSLRVRGDGTLEGFARALRDALEPFRASAGSRTETGAASAKSPLTLRFKDGRLEDEAGGFVATAFEGWVSNDGTGVVAWRGEKPDTGACRVEGTPTSVSVTCERALPWPLAPGVTVSVARADWLREAGRVRVSGARLTGAGLPGFVAALVDGLMLDAETDVRPDAAGQRTLEAALTLPGGGRIEARGTAHARGVSLRTEVAGMALGPVDRALDGRVTGRVAFELDLDTRAARLEGDVRFEDLVVDHRAIADDPVGPYAMSARGRLRLGWRVAEQGEDRRTYALALEEVVLGLGRMEVLLKAQLEADPELRRLSAEIATGRVDAEQLVSAFPPGLLPHLQPLKAMGGASLAAKLAIDVDRPDETVFDVSADVEDLRITRINPAIDFERLRDKFETQFEMPDGEVIRRVTGPNSERWTPLEGVAPLLPIAIVTQEDGGFWNHKGVSLLHLRGSLATNVERGRFARGGSTLTMQLARNLFLNRHKTLSRKLEEVIVAWLMEQTFTKDELITLYLNAVEFGPHLFGIGDAARHYFGKTPLELTPVDVAWLVRLLPGPRRHYEQFEAGAPREYYRTWMQRLLDLLHARGHLSTEQWKASNPADLRFAPPPPSWPPREP